MLSIIIPVYNLKNYIEKTLDSVLSQSYRSIEIIIVDDGSTDRTKEIVDEYAAKYAGKIFVYHISNGGVTNARLFGVSKAQGDWIGFVDGDDIIESDMYERLIYNAEIYNADISHCGYQMIFSDGRISYFHNTGAIIKQDKKTGLRDLLDGTTIEPGLWNKVFRKKLFEPLLQGDSIDKTIKNNEDLLMNFRLFMESDMAIFEDVCKYHYMVRSGSASRHKIDEHKIYDPIKVRKSILTLAPVEVQKEAQKAYIGSCINSYNSLVLEYDKTLVADKRKVKDLIYAKKEWIHLLSKKQQLLANLILYFTFGYGGIYRFYAKYILKNPYE